MEFLQHRTKDVPEEWEQPITAWLQRLIAFGRSPETVRTRAQHLRTTARGVGIPPESVTEDDLVHWATSRAWKPETRNSYYASWRSFFRWYAEKHGCDNPAESLPSIKRPIPPARPIPDEILHAAIQRASERDSLILKLAAFAGMRCAEIARCNLADLQRDLLGYSLVVHGKGGIDRLVPISISLAHDIAARGELDPHGWIFPGNDNGHLSARWISRLGGRLLPTPWTMHQLRHRYGTTVYEHSKDILAVKSLLGHSSIATTQRYVQRPDAAIRTAAQFAQKLY